jgi:uncharacterized protein (TIGR02246 family)
MRRRKVLLMLPVAVAAVAGAGRAALAAPGVGAAGPGAGVRLRRVSNSEGGKPMSARKPEDVHRLWGKGMNAGDLEAVAALYEPGASVVAAPGQVVTGTAAIRETVAGLLALKPRVEIAVRSVVAADDLALLISPWTFSGTGADGSPVNFAGTTSDVVRRQVDGTWLFIVDNPFGSA